MDPCLQHFCCWGLSGTEPATGMCPAGDGAGDLWCTGPCASHLSPRARAENLASRGREPRGRREARSPTRLSWWGARPRGNVFLVFTWTVRFPFSHGAGGARRPAGREPAFPGRGFVDRGRGKGWGGPRSLRPAPWGLRSEGVALCLPPLVVPGLRGTLRRWESEARDPGDCTWALDSPELGVRAVAVGLSTPPGPGGERSSFRDTTRPVAPAQRSAGCCPAGPAVPVVFWLRCQLGGVRQLERMDRRHPAPRPGERPADREGGGRAGLWAGLLFLPTFSGGSILHPASAALQGSLAPPSPRISEGSLALPQGQRRGPGVGRGGQAGSFSKPRWLLGFPGTTGAWAPECPGTSSSRSWW